jgi:hypothetical protein
MKNAPLAGCHGKDAFGCAGGRRRCSVDEPCSVWYATKSRQYDSGGTCMPTIDD